jgi:tetratricopeptide (TPR) repeat protein
MVARQISTSNGVAQLLQADVLVGVDNAAALKLVDQAIENGLPRAELRYAEGLRSNSASAAEKRFRECLDEDRYHPLANIQLGWVLLVQGRSKDAYSHAAAAQTLFPSEPNLGAIVVLSLAADGQRERALAVFKRIGPGLEGPYRNSVWTIAEFLLEHRDVERIQSMSDFEFSFFVAKSIPSFLRVESAGKQLVNRVLYPPFLESMFRSAFPEWNVRELVNVLTAPEKLPMIVDQLLQILDDGTLHYLRGLNLLGNGDSHGAQIEFTKAAGTPSILDVRRAALTHLALSEWKLFHSTSDGQRARWARETVNHLRVLCDHGGTPALWTRLLIQAAYECGDAELARRMATDFASRAPGNTEAMLMRAHADRWVGAYGVAINRYEEFLKRRVSEQFKKAAVDGLKECREKITELAKQVAAPDRSS